jgi:PPOX class probable F420-dependent enzyme
MDVHSFLARQRVAHLATVSPDGKPHVVPVTFAYDGKHIWIALDEKRKSVQPMQLQRVRNIQANPHVALLVDRYGEDWNKLAWVRVDGTARILLRGKAHNAAVRWLRRKYTQYRKMRIETRPVIEIAVERMVQWEAKEE